MTSILFHNDTCSFNHLWYESHKNLITSLCIELGQVDTIPAMIQKFLGDKLKIKPLRDPNQPKRAITSYLYFCNDKRPALMKKNEGKISENKCRRHPKRARRTVEEDDG